MILIYSPSCVNITKSLIHMSAKILLRKKFPNKLCFWESFNFWTWIFPWIYGIECQFERLILVWENSISWLYRKIYKSCYLYSAFYVFILIVCLSNSYEKKQIHRLFGILEMKWSLRKTTFGTLFIFQAVTKCKLNFWFIGDENCQKIQNEFHFWDCI